MVGVVPGTGRGRVGVDEVAGGGVDEHEVGGFTDPQRTPLAGDPADPRLDDIAGDVMAGGVVNASWGLHLIGLVPVLLWLQWVGMPIWAYLLAVYLGTGLLKIRTYLEHRAHEAFRARTVVIEDRGPLSYLFLNNNFHVVHHMHPAVPWYELPALYASRREHYLRRNQAYVYRNYGQIFRQYFWHAKDPVPHPIWPVRHDAAGQDQL